MIASRKARRLAISAAACIAVSRPARRLRSRLGLRRGQRRRDRHRHLAAADRRLQRARQGRAARLRGLGEVRQRERRPARQATSAGDPRRPVQRRPGRLRLREADQPGEGRPGLRAVLDPPRGAGRPGRPGLRLPLRRAGRRGARRSSSRASTTSSTPRPRSPTTTTTCWPSRSWRCRRTSGPKTVAVRQHGRPVRAGHGVRPQGQARGGRDQDRRRRGLPAQHHRLQQHRGARSRTRKADMVVGGTQYQDGVNLIVALQQLNYQPKLAAFSTAPTNAEFPEAIGDKTEGILVADRLHAEGDVPGEPGVREVLHGAARHAAGRGRGQRLDHRSGRRGSGRGGRLRRPVAGVPAEADRLAARERPSTPSSAR